MLNGLEVTVLMLSDVLKDNEVFRIDAEYFKKTTLQLIKKIRIGQHEIIGDSYDISKLAGFEFTSYFTPNNMESNNFYIALTSKNIQNETLNISEFITIDKDVADKNLMRSKLYKHDVILSYTGEYRRALVLQEEDNKFQLGPNVCRLRVSNSKISPFYLSTFFNCLIGQKILDREKTLSAQPTVAMSRIRTITIPLLSQEFQLAIEHLVKQAHSKQAESKSLYATAEALLLDGLNLLGDPTLGYTHHNLKDWVDDPIERLLAHNTPTPREEIALLNAERDEILAEAERLKALFDYDAQLAHLEKALPRLETILALVQQALVKERRIEANRNLGHLSIASTQKYSIQMYNQSFGATGRLDAEYYQPKYEAFFNQVTKFEHCKLTELVEIRKSVETGSEAYSTEGIPYIRVSDISKFGIETPTICISNEYYHENETKLNVLKVKQNTILLSKDGSIGIAYKVDKDLEMLTSGALLHLVVKSNKINPDYLTLVLNSVVVQQQAERDGGGSIIVHWRVSEIEKVIIPILSPELQTEIATLVQQSFALQQQSKQLLALAKQAVEVAIEQNEAAALALMAQQQL